MSSADGDHIQDLFDQALEVPRSQRETFIANACGGKPELLQELRALLLAHDLSEGLWDSIRDTSGSGGDQIPEEPPIIPPIATRKRWPRPLAIKRLVAVSALLILAATALLAYRHFFVPPVAAPRRSFSYWLTVQRMHNGEDYKEPRKSNDNPTFESGDKFQLNVTGPESGFLYVINEGTPIANSASFKMIYPRRTTNDGSATLGANQVFQSEWIVFSGPPGDENFWIVWSASTVPQLESAKNEAFNHPDEVLTGDTVAPVKAYLKAKKDEITVRATRYNDSQKTTVRGTGDLLVFLAQINHK